jgi:RNA polymerase sigma factor (sigma-70 family)
MKAKASPELGTFCRREYPRLVGLLSLYVGDRNVAEELAQEALVRACRDWRKVRAMDYPSAWLHRVGINAANSYFRRRAAERRARSRLETDASRPVHPSHDPASSLVLRQAIAGLPRRQKEVLVLRYYSDMTYVQIGRVLGCSDNTVKSLARRGLQNLRSQTELMDLKEALNAV